MGALLAPLLLLQNVIFVLCVAIPLIGLLLVALAVLLFVVVSLWFGEGVGLLLLHTLLLSAVVPITVVSLACRSLGGLAIAGGCMALDLALLHRLGSAAATEEALTDGSVPDATVAGPANSAALSVDSAALYCMLAVTLLLVVWPWKHTVSHHVSSLVSAFSWDRTRDPGTWPAVVGEVEGVELAQLRAFVDKACARQRRKYSFGIELVRAYELSQPQLRVRYEAFAEKQRRKGKPLAPQRLFHGTSRMSAQEIGRDGFALPRSGGMFGRGIYFTDCPLKSLEYTRGS